jgi:hypothetical protein
MKHKLSQKITPRPDIHSGLALPLLRPGDTRLAVTAVVENALLHEANAALPALPLLAAATTPPAKKIDETEIAMTAEIVTEITMTDAAPAAQPTVTAIGIVT